MTSMDMFQDAIRIESFSPGETIFEQGQPGDVMYLIKDGVVDIMMGDKIVDALEGGDIFGELALIDNEPRSATAIARTNCTLLPINEERFLFFVQKTPYFSLYLMKILADRLRNNLLASS
jgi:CRP-like cAMP-binding protein